MRKPLSYSCKSAHTFIGTTSRRPSNGTSNPGRRPACQGLNYGKISRSSRPLSSEFCFIAHCTIATCLPHIAEKALSSGDPADGFRSSTRPALASSLRDFEAVQVSAWNRAIAIARCSGRRTARSRHSLPAADTSSLIIMEVRRAFQRALELVSCSVGRPQQRTST